jgi:serine/threonine-protein kinase
LGGEGRSGARAAGPGRSGVDATTQKVPPSASRASSGGSGAVEVGSAGISSRSGSGAPAGWDKLVLARAESALAHHVGPLATVLVRRAARECDTWAQLCARLAEHVADPAARNALLGRLQRDAPAVPGRSHGGTAASLPGTAATLALAPLVLRPEVLDRIQLLLAQHLGPIAKVVVRKASADTPSRAAFVDRLAEAVPDGTARERLRIELERLL